MDRDRPHTKEPDGADAVPHRVSLRERRRELTRQALLDGARAAFEEHGYTNTTIDDIASRAGTSRGTFYLYFTKPRVIAELMGSTSPEAPRMVDGRPTSSLRTADLSSRAAVRSWMAPYVDQLKTDARLMRSYLEGDATDPDLQAITDAYFAASVDDLTGRLPAGRDGAIGRDEAHVRATIMLVGFHGFLYQVLGRGHEADLDLGLDILAGEWLRMMRAPPVQRTDPARRLTGTTTPTTMPAATPREPSAPPRRASLRDRQRALTRQALLDGARAAFQDHGYTNVTIDDIASRAGASRATFYLYFTKASVITELIKNTIPSPPFELEGRRTVGLGTADLSSRAAIRARLRPEVELWQKEHRLARAFMEGDATDPDLQAISNAYFATAINDLTDRIHAVHGSAISRNEARARATILVFTLSNFAFRVLGRGHRTDVELGLDTIVDQWLRLLNDPPTRRPDRAQY